MATKVTLIPDCPRHKRASLLENSHTPRFFASLNVISSALVYRCWPIPGPCSTPSPCFPSSPPDKAGGTRYPQLPTRLLSIGWCRCCLLCENAILVDGLGTHLTRWGDAPSVVRGVSFPRPHKVSRKYINLVKPASHSECSSPSLLKSAFVSYFSSSYFCFFSLIPPQIALSPNQEHNLHHGRRRKKTRQYFPPQGPWRT